MNRSSLEKPYTTLLYNFSVCFFIMSNIAVKPFLLLRKRYFAVVRESLRLQGASTNVVNPNVKESASVGSKEGRIFWMRDPKSGNWIPENHFGDHVDAVELRNKFLPKRPQNL